jgi:hypothetical protein
LAVSAQGAQILRFPERQREGVTWEPWLDEMQVASHFGCSTRTVRRWRERGCPSRLVGGLRKYRLSEIDRWHDAQQEASG